MPAGKRAPPAPTPGIDVLFIAGFGPIAQDPKQSKKLYADALQIPFESAPDGYLHTDKVPGAKSFGVWPLAQAAKSCFGTRTWPRERAVPQAWIEFDVADVKAATETLAKRGYDVLVSARTEPWGQTVSRLLSPEGLLVGVTFTPWMRGKPE
jgi:hypothetical protein